MNKICWPVIYYIEYVFSLKNPRVYVSTFLFWYRRYINGCCGCCWITIKRCGWPERYSGLSYVMDRSVNLRNDVLVGTYLQFYKTLWMIHIPLIINLGQTFYLLNINCRTNLYLNRNYYYLNL